MTTFVIRRYRMEDIPAMASLVEQFLQEERILGYRNHFHGIQFDRDVIVNQLEFGLTIPNNFFTNVVIDSNNKIVGGLTAQIVPYIFSNEFVACDYLLYFVPEFTNIKALFTLINSYVEWGKQNNVREIQLKSSTGFKEDKFSKLMTKLDFEQFEVGYSRRT